MSEINIGHENMDETAIGLECDLEIRIYQSITGFSFKMASLIQSFSFAPSAY